MQWRKQVGANRMARDDHYHHGHVVKPPGDVLESKLTLSDPRRVPDSLGPYNLLTLSWSVTGCERPKIGWADDDDKTITRAKFRVIRKQYATAKMAHNTHHYDKLLLWDQPKNRKKK